MADETCDVSVRITPAIANVVVEAEIQTRSDVFILATKEHSVTKKITGLTDASGVAVLTLLRNAKLKPRDDLNDHLYSIRIPKANYDRNMIVPDAATAELASEVVTT